MPIPVQFSRATLTIDGMSYELGDGHVTTEVEQTFTPVMGAGRVVGRTRGETRERVTIEAELSPTPLESDAAFRERIRRMWDSPFNAETASGEALDRIADVCGVTRGGMSSALHRATTTLIGAPPPKPVEPAQPEPPSRWERLMGPDDLV
jgi:hypothetical protein